MNTITAGESRFIHFFTIDPRSAPLWLAVRLYLGWGWLTAGWDKVMDPKWFGADAGAGMSGFVQGALAKTAGTHPDVQMWYAGFLKTTVLPHLTAWANVIAVGELLVGLGLIVGLFTGVAAFFGFFMNLNFMLAGAVSINPIYMVLALGLMTARRVAGYYGLDRYAAPYIKKFHFKKRFF